MKRPNLAWLIALLFGLTPFAIQADFGDTTTYLGEIKYGDGLPATQAYFDFPHDITVDSAGNFFIADTYNGVIRKINTSGIVSTLAGAGGYGDVTGSASQAKFGFPAGVAVDSNGNLYIADTDNGKIKKYSNGTVTTLMSGLDQPEGVAVHGSTVYVTDYGTNKLYSMTTSGGSVRTITSSLSNPRKLYVRSSGDYAFVANSGDFTIVRVQLSNGSITRIAGIDGEAGQTNGTCSLASFRNVWGIHVLEGNSLDEDDIYVTDGTGDGGDINDTTVAVPNTADDGKVRVIDVNGSDGQTANCEVYLFIRDSSELAINYPNAITSYGSNIYVAVTGVGEIQRFTIGDATDYSIFAGADRFQGKNGANGLPGRPKDLVMTDDRSTIYFSENNRIKAIDTDSKSISLLVGSTIDNYQTDDDQAFQGTDGRFSDPIALALSPDEETLYVVDRNNNRLREVNIRAKTVGYLTGAGDVNVGGGFDNGYDEGEACPNEFAEQVVDCAYFTRPAALVVSDSGKYAYVADTGNQVIRRVTLTGTNKGKTKLIAGNPTQRGFQDGTGEAARFNVPIALTFNKTGSALYVADRDNNAIRKVQLKDGKVTTVTGDPDRQGYLDGRLEDAYLNLPVEVYFNKNHIYFSESGTHRIRVVDLNDEAVKLVSGNGNRGFANGDRDSSSYDQPVGIVKKGKNLLIADSMNDLIRRVRIGDGNTIPYTDPAPGVTSVSPASNRVAGSSSDTKALSIRGGEFQHGAVVYFGPFRANSTFVNSANEISVVIPFGEMDPGYYEVKVENIDGQTGTRSRAYSISDTSGNVPVVDYWTE